MQKQETKNLPILWKDICGSIKTRKISGALWKGYRSPTINELFRPFRVGNDITEANSELSPEKARGLEITAAWRASETFNLSLTAYRVMLEDGIGNVTIGFGPGFYPLGGFVPAGGVLRQRSNIDKSVTNGIEARSSWRPTDALTFNMSWQYARARIRAFGAGPDLVGNRPIQTPAHQVAAGMDWQPSSAIEMGLRVRYSGAQYDDDLNDRKLPSFVTLDGRVSWNYNDATSLVLSATNLTNNRVVAAKSATDLETLARHQSIHFGIEAKF